MLHSEKAFADIMKVTDEWILRYRDYPDGPDLITRALKTKVFSGSWEMSEMKDLT